MNLPFNYLAFGAHTGMHSGVLVALAGDEPLWEPDVSRHISSEAQVILGAMNSLMDECVGNARTIDGYDSEVYREMPELMNPVDEHTEEICNILIFTYGCIAFLNGCTKEHIVENVSIGIGLKPGAVLTKDRVTKYLHLLNIEYVNLLQSCLTYLPRDTFGKSVMFLVNQFNANSQIATAHVLLTTVINFYIAELFKAKLAHRIINENGYHEIVPWGKK